MSMESTEAQSAVFGQDSEILLQEKVAIGRSFLQANRMTLYTPKAD